MSATTRTIAQPDKQQQPATTNFNNSSINSTGNNGYVGDRHGRGLAAASGFLGARTALVTGQQGALGTGQQEALMTDRQGTTSRGKRPPTLAEKMQARRDKEAALALAKLHINI